MNWRDDYKNKNYRSRRVLQIVNEHGDEMEIETISLKNHWHVIITICQEKPPFREYLAEGIDHKSEKAAARKALKKLYQKAYPNQ
ncbi:hypothetical protein [Peribacillus frigoritolerans]|uniref:hypothetical protein n=1 Tax=Peribacillus frigoritolerans TaxID=450367 RepID=UPI0010594007|nr:hypothetical protein [Peribacillus frigoritolerans]TDL78988.1 hypothetical protein E2R53_16230 [Peribacillus frigoritolerans]